ncbi:AGE family epimerase/isomerase [Antarcticirhabdus aurantiaca]|uniref:AGE family epimerase/isomerase n=1 Tax=Antarcticirhabdus aurantiaca TaxID=2606717 RepID=A0ACD4NUC5_9HYPH|nr:AGE family epimerase/isomerase [Antarcticirhabdus aurantiaca]WAJ30392.1 AGE family epimerase/isomerase [Jeongeuplla avenae]
MADDDLKGSWLERPAHREWLEDESRRLLRFAAASRLERGGFGMLDEAGRLPPSAEADTLFTARAAHCYAVAALRGVPGAKPLADHGVASLRSGLLRDEARGGWFESERAKRENGRKTAYIQMFVALAASSALLAGCDGARALLDEVLTLIEARFWSNDEGRVLESYADDWSDLEDYRGGNSNMHATEAFLAVADATGDEVWLERALSIVRELIHEGASASGYHVTEHYRADWTPWPNYNQDDPAHSFRPFGITPGHAFEWSRLALGVEGSLRRAGRDAPDWLASDARALFEAALAVGWAPDGRPGIVYTADWAGRPVVDARLHWPVTEAISAASMLLRRTGDPLFERWYRRLWDYAETYLIDRDKGSWRHELDALNRPAAAIWPGKPDLYHAYQATILPLLGPAPALARAVADQGGA